MNALRVFFLIIWLVICGGALTGLNIADEYRDRAASEWKSNLAVETLNGNSIDFANLQAAKKVESSSRVLISCGRVSIIILLFGVSYFITLPLWKSNKKEQKL